MEVSLDIALVATSTEHVGVVLPEYAVELPGNDPNPLVIDGHADKFRAELLRNELYSNATSTTCV